MNAHPRRRLLLLGGAACALRLLTPAMAARPGERRIQVRARRFRFEPDQIQLARGVPVTLEFTSLDVPMGFNAPDFGVRTDILPGAVTRVRFTPGKSGKFLFHCDLFCGAGHEDMNGFITVS